MIAQHLRGCLARCIPKAELYGLNSTNNDRLVIFSGGITLLKDGKNSSLQHEVKVVEAAVKAFENLY